MLIYTQAQAAVLMRSAPRREDFGPFSRHPYLAIKLDREDENTPLRNWLRNLPCPVIGIGDGPLGESCDVIFVIEIEAKRAVDNIKKWPIASMVLVQQLRASEHLSMQDALMVESFAYATLQQGPEFESWLEESELADVKIGRPSSNQTPLLSQRGGDVLHLTMNDPIFRNAIGGSMRDALTEALELALADPEITKVTLTGKGRWFSSGGEVSEFGKVSDPATAHLIRSMRLPAQRLASLTERLHVHVSGAAIGAGAEMAAFGGRVTASKDAWFQLPELKYGLIPGAGGTVSLSRKIGRQYTAKLAFSMKRISARKALEWGLVDEIV